MLDRRPGTLEEHAVLRIGELSLTATHPEEGGIELIDAIHDGGGVHEARLGGVGGGGELGIRELTDRFDALAEVRPERIDVGGSWKPPRHADDGDLLVVLGVTHRRDLALIDAGPAGERERPDGCADRAPDRRSWHSRGERRGLWSVPQAPPSGRTHSG